MNRIPTIPSSFIDKRNPRRGRLVICSCQNNYCVEPKCTQTDHLEEDEVQAENRGLPSSGSADSND